MFEIIMLVVVIILVVSLVGIIVFINISSKKQREKRQIEANESEVLIQQIIEDEGIPADAFWSDDNFLNKRTALAINDVESVVIVANFPKASDLKSGREVLDIQRIDFKDIIEVNILVNSIRMISTSGTAGINELNRDPESNEPIRKMSLVIVTNRQSKSINEIPFYVSIRTELKVGTPEHDQVSAKINDWYQKLADILQQAQK